MNSDKPDELFEEAESLTNSPFDTSADDELSRHHMMMRDAIARSDSLVVRELLQSAFIDPTFVLLPSRDGRRVAWLAFVLGESGDRGAHGSAFAVYEAFVEAGMDVRQMSTFPNNRIVEINPFARQNGWLYSGMNRRTPRAVVERKATDYLRISSDLFDRGAAPWPLYRRDDGEAESAKTYDFVTYGASGGPYVDVGVSLALDYFAETQRHFERVHILPRLSGSAQRLRVLASRTRRPALNRIADAYDSY